MDWIDSMVSLFGNYVYSLLPDGLFRGLMVDGIIAGIGGIVIFLPQIILLMLFMTILEDTGYMTRATFMMDRFMRAMGLHGKSVLPIMSGYACAIPGIISTNGRDTGGLKKCTPITFSGRLVAAAISVIDNEDVFDAKIACFGV